MSALVKLAGKLPGDPPVNGVDQLAEALRQRYDAGDPNNPAAVLVIGILKVREYRTARSTDGVTHIPTVELSRVEVLGVLGADEMDLVRPDGSVSRGLCQVAPQADQQRLLTAAEARTGETPLPIDADGAEDAESGIKVL